MSLIPGEAPLGIIATQASIRAGAFRRELERLCPGREIIDLPCPRFVPLIESGHTGEDDPELKKAVEDSLAAAKEAGIAALLLGCTHYGLIAPAISAFLGEDVKLVSASRSAARAALPEAGAKRAYRRQRRDPVLHQRRRRGILRRRFQAPGPGYKGPAAACNGDKIIDTEIAFKMMKDVVISIRTVHCCDTDEEDYLDFTTDGLYGYDGEVGCLSYMETEVTGMEGTRTSVIVMPDQVVVDRDGMITSRMIFREGEKSSLLYNTPYGTATMNISTRRISHSLDGSGGAGGYRLCGGYGTHSGDKKQVSPGNHRTKADGRKSTWLT